MGRHLGDVLKNLVANAIWWLLPTVLATAAGLVALVLRADQSVAVAAIAVVALAAIGTLLVFSRRSAGTRPGSANVVIRVHQGQPEEAWLEWLHLEAENIGQERALGAWIRMRVL